MTRHLLKLIWNRRRTNLLLMAEIFFSFLVLFAVVTLGLFYFDNWRRPLGLVYEKKGAREHARGEYAAALDLDPSLPEARKALTTAR